MVLQAQQPLGHLVARGGREVVGPLACLDPNGERPVRLGPRLGAAPREVQRAGPSAAKTIPDGQGSRARITKQTCRGPFSAAPKLIFFFATMLQRSRKTGKAWKICFQNKLLVEETFFIENSF